MKEISALQTWLTAASLTAVLMTGCNKPSVEVRADPLPPPRDEVLEAKSTIVGKWMTGCRPAEGAPGIFATVDITFEVEQANTQSGKLSVTGQGFSNAACTAPLGAAETTVGTYHISGKNPTPGLFDIQTTLPDGVGGWETLYDVMTVQNGLLYFSKEGELKAEKRPTQINYNLPYHR